MRHALAFFLAVALAGCVTISSSSIGTFAGVLPCADCSGILAELRLYAEQPSGRAERYELTEAYLGARDDRGSIGLTGRWETLRGSASDRDATVIRLEIGPREAQLNFLRVGDDELRLLDRNRREIFSAAPHSLHRVSDLPAMTLVEGDSGRTIDIERGQRVFVVLGADRSTGYDWTLDSPGPGLLSSLGNPVYVQGTLPGSGGTEIWTFRVGQGGKQELVFRYRRPQPRDAPAARTVSYTISVR